MKEIIQKFSFIDEKTISVLLWMTCLPVILFLFLPIKAICYILFHISVKRKIKLIAKEESKVRKKKEDVWIKETLTFLIEWKRKNKGGKQGARNNKHRAETAVI